MPYRLPLELELIILTLAAPALEMDSLHARVDFFIEISLVHRSLTAWAQDKLHDQFLYTYRPRVDEYERLKKRFEAGFGRDRPLRRLYLDLTQLPDAAHVRKALDTDSVSVTIDGRVLVPLRPTSALSGSIQDGAATAQKETFDEVARFVVIAAPAPGDGYWELCAMITSHCQALDTLWLKPPILKLDLKALPPPRVLYIYDDDYFGTWGYFGSLPISSKTALFLRNMILDMEGNASDLSALDLRQVVFDRCSSRDARVCDLLEGFHRLETLILSAGGTSDPVTLMVMLPASIRRVHLLLHIFDVQEDQTDSPRDLPRLESFTFTWLVPAGHIEYRAPAQEDSDSLTDLQRVIKANVVAPQCTFKYLRSTKSPESALADAVAAFNLF